MSTKVQSIPAQDEKPQLFETVEEITARREWNAIKPKLYARQDFKRNVSRLYIKGTDHQLKPGDAILLVGKDRETKPGSEKWDFRYISSVELNNDEDYSVIHWQEGLGHYKPRVEPDITSKAYVFRQRAALFGYNAPEWYSVSDNIRLAYLMKDLEKKYSGVQLKTKCNDLKSNYLKEDPRTWKNDWPSSLFCIQDIEKLQIYFDTIYPKIIEGSWIVLEKPNYRELYKVMDVVSDSCSAFTLSAKSTRITVDTNEHLSWFPLRNTIVFGQSEKLELADVPIIEPVFDKILTVEKTEESLVKDQIVIIAGKPLKYVKVAPREYIIKIGKREEKRKLSPLQFTSGEEIEQNSILSVVKKPKINETKIGEIISWFLKTEDGTSGIVKAERNDFIPVELNDSTEKGDDDIIYELVQIEKTENCSDNKYVKLHFKSDLKNVYLRNTVRINANIAFATHGETKTEVFRF